MPTSVIEYILRVVGDGLRDGELVGRYVDRRDEAALAALVNRHGPMVWGVCRRLLNHHDAEDAFQATFIVLVRKASSIAHGEAVGNWLYGVAHQTALQARRSAARRRAREVQVTEMPDAEAPQERWADVRPILDEELSRLPDHYRAVIVLSDLEGRTRKQVAAQLGCPEGTVASRLVRARAMLAKRLTGRGVALSGGVLAAALSRNAASAGVPTSVVMSTIKAANLGQVPVEVAALAEGVLKAMLVSKLKAAVAVVLVLGFLGAIGFGIASEQQKEPSGKQESEPKAQKGDVPQKDEKPKVEPVVKDKADKEEAIAWGKKVDGLQAGLVADAGTCRQGEKLKLTVKLRNVGKTEVTITYRLLKECAPQVTNGAKVSVFMPAPKDYLAVPIKRAIKPGETITLYRPEVAVEPEALMRLEGIMQVETPTICVDPGKYKITYGGMIQSHPKLSTDPVEFEVKAPKNATAWGKEVDGVQVGVRLGEDRVYKVGESVTLIVRLRNNGKKDVPHIFDEEYFQKNPPLITDADGKAVKIKERNIFGILDNSSVAPGKEVDLCMLRLDLRPDTDRKKEEVWTLYGTGKFHIQYKDLPVVGDPLQASVPTYATGKLELEVKDADDKKPVGPPAKQKEVFTERGQEVGGLQAGLGYKAGEKRAYSHGETVTLVVRVRNVGKEAVKFQYNRLYFVDILPTVTDSDGKQVRLSPFPRIYSKIMPETVDLAPGKEIELAELKLKLRPANEAGDETPGTLYGTGKIQIRHKQLSVASMDPILSKLPTGKLELEVREVEKK